MPEKISHAVLTLPGLGDGEKFINFSTRNWQNKYSFDIITYSLQWNNPNESLEEKYEKLEKYIDTIRQRYQLLSIMGISGGGSVAIFEFLRHPNFFHRAINVSGRLHTGIGVTPSLEVAGKGKPAFIQSVKNVEKSLKEANPKLLPRIMTIRPILDEMVPVTTIPIEGAKNVQISSILHVPSIIWHFSFLEQLLIF